MGNTSDKEADDNVVDSMSKWQKETEERQEKIRNANKKQLDALQDYKCEYKMDDNGSITFFPTPPKMCKPSSKKLDETKLLNSRTLKSLLGEVKCKQLESINDYNTNIIENRYGQTICSFITASITAWSEHYPLRFKPDHIWLLILQAVALHVDKNAEKLRKKYVTFEGKKKLEIIRDDFVKGSQNNDWIGVIEEFAEQIDKNTVQDTVSLFENDFSCSTLTDKIATKCTIMDICKNYFEYKMSTCCGFPQITLEGNKGDWIRLREKTEKLLATKVDKKFGAEWGKALLPLLDRFVDTFNGKIDGLFWNSMIKRGAQGGSGGWSWYTGWINILFPFIQNKENEYCVPYSADEDYVKQGLNINSSGMMGDSDFAGTGVDVEDYPAGIASAPVTWDYHGTDIKLQFVSGFMGYVQDGKTLEITPNVAWFIAEE